MSPTTQRPAFTVSAAAARPVLPLGAWAAACFGVGGVFAAAAQRPPCIDWCTWDAPPPAVLGFAGLLASAAWFVLPLNGGLRRTLFTAGFLCLAAGALVSVPLVARSNDPFGRADLLPLLAAGGLAAPAFMLPAISPGASLERPGARSKGPVYWLRVGALPTLALFTGLAVSSLFHLPGALAGPTALGLAGALLLRAGQKAPREEGRSKGALPGRAARLLRMTPMLRLHAFGEIAVAFAAASCAVVALRAPGFSQNNSLLLACALGGAAGCALYAVLAPRVDAAWGRGRLLSIVLFCCALAPLVLLSGPLGPPAMALFGAGALLAFVVCSSPQRGALAFDLSSFQGRLRLSGDLQGLKLLGAAAAPPAFLVGEQVAPGLGPLAAATVSIVAFALFAPALGSLGVPRH